MSMIPIWLSMLITALAAIRVARLFSTDLIGLPLRQAALRRSGETGWLTAGIHCKYCVTVWAGMVAAPLWYFFGHDAWFICCALAGAIAQLQVYLAKLDEV